VPAPASPAFPASPDPEGCESAVLRSSLPSPPFAVGTAPSKPFCPDEEEEEEDRAGEVVVVTVGLTVGLIRTKNFDEFLPAASIEAGGIAAFIFTIRLI
jgi:hypothetical protein